MKLLLPLKMFLLVLASVLTVQAQEETEEADLQQVLKQEGYDRNAPAVVKLVSDQGRRIGAGVILGVHEDGMGFILTSYSMVANRDKVAVILKDYPDPLLGRTVERWVDFDTDVAIVAVKNFPADQPVIVLSNDKSVPANETFTIIGHAEEGDWMPIPIQMIESDESHVAFNASEFSGIEGAPLVDEDGKMLGLIVSEGLANTENNLTLAVKTATIKPIIKEWFKPVPLVRKWEEQGVSIGGWVWAVGGSVIGGTLVTAIAISGGDGDSQSGLPRPPNPPNQR
ncbi:trypsin-like peptidase domain-containing protein [candidate division KSB1 bacterium]|nr:trypsin-like peptidase domain-containing protein [candidate division KSB1 bacterium]NIR73322.1 trypsin-like peptidase domain-containing protein [candidate division KSB1 bacterium]NIS27028.1 trypsin-like peptidase domain-containing protein [candidate division KSB1 bacterium]NIT73868.1 trypsin-like peptidase domain-containing protein [candidate division KSB1 bacterium]NIU27773.1 trypsin-like peptidase domain-containing protein [candidate division KSB1 bacterium]